MTTALLVKIDLLVGLVSLLLASGLFLHRKHYFASQKNVTREISKVASELKRNMLQYLSKSTAEPKKLEKKKAPSSVNLAEVNKILRKVEIELTKGELETAERMLVEALALSPENSDVLKKLAFIYLKTEKFSKAETIYLKLIEKGTTDPLVYSNLGVALFSQGKVESAVAAYQKAIDLDPHKANRYVSLGQIHFETDNLKGALTMFQEAVRREPRNIEYLFTLGRAYNVGELYEQSLKVFKKVLEYEPYNEEAKLEIIKLRESGVKVD